MALLGKAALAMWWDMAAQMREDFEDWHSHEHFPERLGIPGFRRSSRWTSAAGGEGVFVMYELEDFGVLSSVPYLARLNAPTPWSTKLMPHHRNMVRSQSHVLETRGGVVARQAMTLRLTPAPERREELRAALRSLIERLATAPGFAGAHLLQHQTPDIAQTTEQKIRGSADQVADWVLVVCAYDAAALEALANSELSSDSLERRGAAATMARETYSLSYSATAAEVAVSSASS
jgi:hypothetical protein